MPVTPHRRWLGPLFALLLLWLLFFWRILTPIEADRLTFQQGDFTLQFLAYRQLAYRQLLAGRFPVIEECLYSGHPFQADPQSQVLYPPVFALMLLGRVLGWSEYPLRALEWEVMLHVLWAAVGMYILLQGMAHGPRLRPIAALVGALAYAFGGFMTGYAMLQTAILQTAAWLPWILIAVRWLATAECWLAAAGTLAVLVFFAFTAGHPQTMLYIAYVAVVAFIFWFWQAHSDSFVVSIRRGVVRAVVAGGLALGLSAAQLLPTLLFMMESNRASLTFAQAGRGFALHDVVLFVLTGVSNVWQPLYAGLAPLILAGSAIVAGSRYRSEVRLWLAVGLVALALSFGSNALGFDLAYLVAPGYRQFQSQERHAMVVSAALCVLAAHGMDSALCPLRWRARSWLRRAARVLAMWGIVVFSAIIVVLIAQRVLDESDQLLLASSRLALVAFGLLGTAALLGWRARLGRWPRWAWGSAVLALVVFDLFTANRYTATQPLADPFPPNPLIAPMLEAQSPRSSVRVYNHFGLPLNGACIAGLNEVGGGSPIAMRAYKAFLERVPEAVMVKLLNARYAVTWRGAMETPEGVMIPWFLLARSTFEGNPASTYRLDWEPQDFDGAWVPQRIVRVRSEDELYAYMRRSDFNPFIEAVVLHPPEALLDHSARGSAAVEGKSPGYIKVAAYAEQPALLAISQAYHRNWIALVNGQEVAPLPIYGALLGVPIPAGPVSVELSYRPTDFYVGLAISGITALAIVLVIALAIGARRAS